MAALTKLALKRDQSVPAGQPAPLYLDCPCGTRIDVQPAGLTGNGINVCAGCGAAYDGLGWLIRKGTK
jgi:hypothetical protein